MAIVLYKLVCMITILFIQCGFLLLESGLTREKNSYHVAIKNVVNFFVSSVAFALVGAHVAHVVNPSVTDHWDLILGTLFCSIVTSIVSGAIAERCRFDAYIVMVAVSSMLIYPVAVYLCWSSLGFFTQLGFVDKAGSTVVHICGGCMALAAAMVIGPRKGFFDRGSDVSPVPASNMTMASLAVFFMVIGWIGFNLGSMDPRESFALDRCLVNIFAGAAGGAVTGVLLGRTPKGQYDIRSVLFGSIAGLVGITAGFHVISVTGSLVLGSLAAWVSSQLERLLLKLRIDDAIGAFPVHFGGGLVGTIGLVFFTDSPLTWQSLAVQTSASLVIAFWSFTAMYLFLLFIDRNVLKLRVTAEAEEDGLNISEHQSPSLADLLCREIDEHFQSMDFSKPVYSEPFTTIGRVAYEYNRLTSRLQEVLRKNLDEFSRLGEIGLQVAGIAHDIRTPLQILSAQSYLLKNGEMDAERQKKASKVIAGECKRIETMCSLLLERSHSKKIDADQSSQLSEVLQDISHLQRERLAKSSIQLDLPTIDFVLPINKSDLIRVLDNLIENAKKAILTQNSFSKESPKWVRVGVESTSTHTFITVEDNGPGVAEDQVELIFRLYLSDEHIHRQHGFGLATCENLLFRNGATIELLRRCDPTTFQIKIPKQEKP